MPDNHVPKIWWWMAAMLAGMVVIAALVIHLADRSRHALPEYGTVPVFSLTDQQGAPVTQQYLLGKFSIVDFMFTTCPSACPVMTDNMRQLYQMYAHSDQIQFISITVDPDRDTEDVLQQFARQYGVRDNRWKFLHGPLPDVVRLSEKGFMLPAENLPMGHSTKFVLVDPAGMIRGYYDGMNDDAMKVLQDHIRSLAGARR